MNATVPPWLDTNPAQALSAAETGARLGMESRQLDMSQMEMQQRNKEAAQNQALQVARLAMEKQQTDMAHQMQLAQLSISKQTNDREFALKQQQMAQSIELEKLRSSDEWQRAALQYQGMNQYQSVFNSLKAQNPDMSDSDAMFAAAAHTGYAPPGIAGLERTSMAGQQITDETGNPIGYYGADGKPTYIPRGKQQPSVDEKSLLEYAKEYVNSNPGATIQDGLRWARQEVGGGGAQGASSDGQYLTPTQDHIQMLLSNPSLASKFDEVYGPGASKRYLSQSGGVAPGGGASPSKITLDVSIGGDDTSKPIQGPPTVKSLKDVFKSPLKAPSGNGEFYLDKDNKIKFNPYPSPTSLGATYGGAAPLLGPTQDDLAWIRKIYQSVAQ